MTPAAPPALPPIVRSISVSWDPVAAFDRFTAKFSDWWPIPTHSIGGPNVQRVTFECRPGGRIFEEHADGRRFQWGVVLEWEPPRRVRFSWHPSRDESTSQTVELVFTPEGAGTRLTLTSWDWERWGQGAAKARKGYHVGWGYVLNVWAQRRTPSMAVLDMVAKVLTLIQRFRGGAAASIAKAGGEIPHA